MSCLLTNGLSKDCAFFLGGITELYLANKSEFSGATSSSGIVATIVMVGSGKFKEIEFEKNTGSFANEMVVSNGQKYVNQSVSFSLAKKDGNTLVTAEELALGTYVAIAKDRNNKYFILGRYNGLEATVTTLSSGAAEGDFGGLVVTLTGAEKEFASEFTGVIPV